MGKSVSVTMGKGSLNHNNRVFKTKNVDPSLSAKNVVFVQQTLEDAYCKIFGEALKNYNTKQKRNDRKIPDYLEHIKKSKNGEKPFHEIVAQVGDRYDTGIKTADAEISKEILSDYYHTFVERNPQMRVFNAVIHMDEFDGTPHLHLDFIPTATKQSRGLETRNSMRKALEQQGYEYQMIPSKDKNLLASYSAVSKIGGGRWLDAERKALAVILTQRGIAYEEKGVHRSNLSVAEYKVCAEIIDKEQENARPAEMEMRESTLRMRIAGVRENEIIVARSSVEVIQQENVALRTQVEIQQKTICRMDTEKRLNDGFIQRFLKEVSDREREVEVTKEKYSQGTAEKYTDVARRYNELASKYNMIVKKYKALTEKNVEIERATAMKIKNAVEEATQQLKTELWRSQSLVNGLQKHLHSVCQTLHDIMRATFTFGFKYKDKSANPYHSELTDDARYLLNALEEKSRTVLNAAGEQQLANELSGMGVSSDLERAVDAQRPERRESIRGTR